MGVVTRAGVAAAIAAAQVGLAYRFALAYRARAGYPRRFPPTVAPTDVGLPFESLTVLSEGVDLPAWFIPARDGAAGPGVVLVHGWESARDRTLPLALFLHAAGFHTMSIDVRGHGGNPADRLPISAGEFGIDALAAFRAMIARPDVTAGAIVGHSMGGIGAVLASAADPRVVALVATSTPADPYRLTRQTFRLARLPIPDPIAYPLAWLTTRVYLRPRGHVVQDISAADAIARFRGPILLTHGDADQVVPIGHLHRLADAARISRLTDTDRRPVETLVVHDGQHSWLYEDAGYRATVARFLTKALGGPLEPDEAAAIAAATIVERVPAAEERLSAVDTMPGGFRSLAQVALPGATRIPDSTPLAAADEPGLG